MGMKALSVRQPWSWLVLYAAKDIENRTWKTQVRGRVLLHAAKGMTREEWLRGMAYAEHVAKVSPNLLRAGLPDTLERGGLVGSVEIVDCVTESSSPWYMGAVGFVLRDPRPMSFIPCKGALNFFEIPDSLLIEHGVDPALHH